MYLYLFWSQIIFHPMISVPRLPLLEEVLFCTENENSIGFTHPSTQRFYNDTLSNPKLSTLRALLNWNKTVSLSRWKCVSVWEGRVEALILDRVDKPEVWSGIRYVQLPSTVTTLYVSRGDFSKWEHLPTFPESLTSLEIYRTRLTSVPPTPIPSFANPATQIAHVNLSHNELQSVEGLDLRECRHLRTVILKHNKIRSLKGLRLPKNVFIEELNLESNCLTLRSFQQTNIFDVHLACLNLSRNNIKGPLTSECPLCLPPGLMSLNLSFNPIGCMTMFRLPRSLNDLILKQAHLEGLHCLPALPRSLRMINLEATISSDSVWVYQIMKDIETFNHARRQNHLARVQMCRGLLLYSNKVDDFARLYPLLYFLSYHLTDKAFIRKQILQFWNPGKLYPWENLKGVAFF